MEENLNANISFTFPSIYDKNVTCKRDPEAQDRDETETFDFQSETRPRRSHISPRPRRDRDVEKMRLETVSRPRRRDRDYIPATISGQLSLISLPGQVNRVRLAGVNAECSVHVR